MPSWFIHSWWWIAGWMVGLSPRLSRPSTHTVGSQWWMAWQGPTTRFDAAIFSDGIPQVWQASLRQDLKVFPKIPPSQSLNHLPFSVNWNPPILQLLRFFFVENFHFSALTFVWSSGKLEWASRTKSWSASCSGNWCIYWFTDDWLIIVMREPLKQRLILCVSFKFPPLIKADLRYVASLGIYQKRAHEYWAIGAPV